MHGTGSTGRPASLPIGRPAVRGAWWSLAILTAAAASGQAQTVTTQLPTVDVSAPGVSGAYAGQANFHSDSASVGPLGAQPILTTPLSLSVIPEDLLVNQQIRTVNDALRALPSVEVRDQQGLEVSRPQSRGFQGTIVQNTRLDGLNIIGTTAVPAENLQEIQVLNGLAGSLYGPETPAGVFNYVLRRPTDTTLVRAIESYDSDSLFAEDLDAGGRGGPNDSLGYRINLVHGEGESFVSGSFADRTLVSGDFDIHVDDRTVIELDASYYEDTGTGLPGSFAYDGVSKANSSTLLPAAQDPTRVGYGQPGAGTDLVTDTGLAKIRHRFNDDWSLTLGGLYQDAIRNLFGISNTFNDNRGDFTTTKNFTAVPHFTIGSNEAYLNGNVRLLDVENDVTLGTNGFINGQYNYRDSIVTTLGSATLADPILFPFKPIPYNGGQYKAATLFEQSIIEGDTVHLDRQLALQAVFSESFLRSRSYNTSDAVTSADTRNGVFSPTVSLIYQPTRKLTAYASYSSSTEEGEEAAASDANANQFLAPYHDEQYEVGIKYAILDRLLVTLDGFRITRPLADTLADNVFQVIGTQRNYGGELFAQGDVTPGLSVLGGVTYIDARLRDTGVASTDGGLVVGVPNWKTDLTLDYHPHFARGFALTGAIHYESDRAATNTNLSFAPAYVTLDLGVRYSTPLLRHFLTARLGIVNVTNKSYYSSVADGNIVGSPGANTAYLGTPRVVLASVEVDL